MRPIPVLQKLQPAHQPQQGQDLAGKSTCVTYRPSIQRSGRCDIKKLFNFHRWPSSRHLHLAQASSVLQSYSPPSNSPLNDKVDDRQDLSTSPDNKRRISVEKQEISQHKRPPSRRLGHLSSKSTSAVPTLSTLVASAPAIAAPQSPTKPGQPPRSWLGRRASIMAATSQDGHLSNPHTAADLLRQAMMHR